MENEKNNRTHIFKVLTQWVFLPVITFMVGIVGTYTSQVSDLKQIQGSHTHLINENIKAILDEKSDRIAYDRENRIQTEERIKNVVILLEALLKQNTEVITLFRVQQQMVKP